MREDFWRITVWLTISAVIGVLVSDVSLALFVGSLAYILWQQRRLSLLLRWVEDRKQNDPPESPGVYDAICREIDFMRERHRKRKKKLGGFLKQFQVATAALPDAAVVLGPQDDIQWANAAAQDLLGIQWPRDATQRIVNLVRHPQLVHLLSQATRGDRPIEIAAPAHEDLILSIVVVPMGQNQHLLLARNVTRLHRLNQVRSDFVANVSHELRTPVTVIKGYLEAINFRPESCPQEWQPIFSELESQATRMGNIIDELLLLARLEQDDAIPDPEEIVVPEMIEDIVRQAQALNNAAPHEFIVEVDQMLWLLGARNEIYSAFSNLIVNAVRYTPAGGRITLRWYQDVGGVHFEVADTGIGIPREHIPRLTERFYRVDQSRSRESGGTGLGLAIVKHVLKRHHAKLYIESSVGKGSMFRCDFPLNLLVLADSSDHREHRVENRRR